MTITFSSCRSEVAVGRWLPATSIISLPRSHASISVIALGGAEPSKTPGTFAFTVTELGVYVRDSYDFNDAPGEDQELGNWDPDDNSVGRTFLNGGTTVKNSDFRKWRAANGKGNDYLIYSDVLYSKLATPERFELHV